MSVKDGKDYLYLIWKENEKTIQKMICIVCRRNSDKALL